MTQGANEIARNGVIMATAILGNHASAFVPAGVSISLAAVMVAASRALEARSAEPDTVKDIGRAHGANTDGSGWRGVYDILIQDGYHVSVVQEPLTAYPMMSRPPSASSTSMDR
jgi:hypothetical protein